MSEDVYTRLREFMDKLPAGYPETPTGVEIKILKKLWTPDEAELTMKLKNEPEEISVIAKRVGMDEAEMAEKLEAMAQKGIIFRVRSMCPLPSGLSCVGFIAGDLQARDRSPAPEILSKHIEQDRQAA